MNNTMKQLSFVLICSMILLLATIGAAMAQNPVKVSAYAEHYGGKLVYHYRVTNNSPYDIAGGYAALTVTAPDAEVTTVEYKINFLAGFNDGELRAIGKVAKAGKRIIVTTAEVMHIAPDGKQNACAVMQQTLVPVPKKY